MKVYVASDNPVKIEAVRGAFSRYFDDVQVISRVVSSAVPDQPVGADTFRGAEQRARSLFESTEERARDGEFYVGIEGGVIRQYERWFVLGVMCIIDHIGRVGFGVSPAFELPEYLAAPLLDGTELGKVIDDLTGERDTKRHGGAIGYLTNGVVDRHQLYVQGLLVALVPFLNKGLYFDHAH